MDYVGHHRILLYIVGARSYSFYMLLILDDTRWSMMVSVGFRRITYDCI